MADLKHLQKGYEIVFQRDFGVDLQQLQDRTPLGIMHHVRKQQQELDRQLPPVSPDHPKELVKDPPTQVWAINSTQVEQERHGERKQPEPEPQPLTERTITVTSSKTQDHRPFLERYKAKADELIRKQQQQTQSRDNHGRER